VSQPANVDIVRAAILAQNAGDDETLLAAIDSAVEWHTEGVAGPEAPPVLGREALRSMLQDARREVGEVRVTMHEIQEAGDAVLVIGTVSTGNGMRMPRAWIWQLRDGLAVRVESYLGRDQALRVWEKLRRGGEAS
jgi:ketosteroid isomerase-like protein